jgi:hypothetical protein
MSAVRPFTTCKHVDSNHRLRNTESNDRMNMTLKRLIASAAVTGALGAAALGLGAGLAIAERPPGPGPVVVQPPRPDVPGQDRDGYDRAVRDHRPFQYQANG